MRLNIKKIILTATLVTLSAPLFGAAEPEKSKTTLTPASASGSAAKEEKHNAAAEQEDNIVTNKRSGLNPWIFGGVLAATAIGLGNICQTLPEPGIKMYAGCAAAILHNTFYSPPKMQPITKPQTIEISVLTSGKTTENGQAQMTDEPKIDHDNKVDAQHETIKKEIQDIAKKIGLNGTLRWTKIEKFSSNVFEDEHGIVVGIIEKDIERLLSSNEQQKNIARAIIAHEMIHIREKHSTKQFLLNYSWPWIYMAATPAILRGIDMLTKPIPKVGSSLGSILKGAYVLFPALECALRISSRIGLKAPYMNFYEENMLSNPFKLTYSRLGEREADLESALTTGNAQGLIDYFNELHTNRSQQCAYKNDTLPWYSYLYFASHPSDKERITYLEPIAKLQAQGKSEQEIRQPLWPWKTFWNKHQTKILGGVATIGAAAAGAYAVYKRLRR